MCVGIRYAHLTVRRIQFDYDENLANFNVGLSNPDVDYLAFQRNISIE